VLIGVLRGISEIPIAMRAEARDDDEEQHHQRGVARSKSEEQTDAADEFDRWSNVTEKLSQIAARHGFREAWNIDELTLAAGYKDPAYQNAGNEQQKIPPSLGDSVDVGQVVRRSLQLLCRHGILPKGSCISKS